jgi:hypothetical protein
MANNDLTQYSNVRHLMKTGDLLTYRTRGVVSTLIHIWSAANHAGLVLSLAEYEGETHRRWTLEAVGGGARTAYLSYVLERVHGQAFWHPLKPEYEALRTEIGAWAMTHSGCTKYDFLSLIKNIFGLVSADMNRLFCSEYVFMAWKSQGIVSGDKAPRPSQLAGLGVTLPPVLIVDSGPEEPHPPVQP